MKKWAQNAKAGKVTNTDDSGKLKDLIRKGARSEAGGGSALSPVEGD